MRFLTSLSEFLKNEDETQVDSILKEFKCIKNADLEDFIHNKAIDYEKKDRARTFLFIDNGKIEAFFSLALNVLDTTKFSNTFKKRLSPINSKNDNAIACFLIGQLGKDDSAKIKGKEIFDTAMGYLLTSHNILASKFILIDAVNNDKVISFYKANGFEQISVDEDGQTTKMVRFFKDK